MNEWQIDRTAGGRPARVVMHCTARAAAVGDADDDAALAWGLAVAVLQCHGSTVAQVD
jgi:hypothetical protein